MRMRSASASRFKTQIIDRFEELQMERVLIVNADDFGQSAAISRGICRAHQQGIVTSASLMVRWPDAAYAVEYCDGLDLGLHIDLGEWTYRSGSWAVLYERVPLDDEAAV